MGTPPKRPRGRDTDTRTSNRDHNQRMNAANSIPNRAPDVDLSSLARMPLEAAQEDFLSRMSDQCFGSPIWRHRRLVEARDLFALARFSRRFLVQWLDLSVDFRAVIRMEVPAPCAPGAEGGLTVRPFAVLAIRYIEEAVHLPQPGTRFITILDPRDVWLPNVSPPLSGEPQGLCLGTHLPRSIRVRELVLMAFSALRAESIQPDPYDTAGVMNGAASAWWLKNLEQAPLSRDPFVRSGLVHLT